MKNLPKWITDIDSEYDSLDSQAIVSLREALSIAWEALWSIEEQIREIYDCGDLGHYKNCRSCIAKEAMSRIAKLGEEK